MLVSKKFYEYFLRSKYLNDKYAKEKMGLLYKSWIRDDKVLTPESEVEIEKKVLGHPLPWKDRMANNGVFRNPWMILNFLNEADERSETLVELSESINRLAKIIFNSLSPEMQEKARAEGLLGAI